ncbi:MAG: heat shock protein HspQ [Planctomycetota bacterium]
MIRFIDNEPRFVPGDLVRHRRYSYRGLIVAVDCRCRASHEWYMGNRTQPDQNQPWYHVLVDGSAASTYAAQSNLVPDASDEPLDHPLLEEYFEVLSDGRYQRNDRQYAGW